ncbi:hypothetical protein EUAN_24360 [Andreesenia angusta]|uniref:Uncharacterized protein n=1 Tax=Andreesenia angusta TaxID=39480 RepID=A0A1S1V3C7_9FIRM|nr:hypothetical protein [Andreesenia angusta]OHW61211.1 hypothetical protein EUAN_24360 [Andreesenia angusta]
MKIKKYLAVLSICFLSLITLSANSSYADAMTETEPNNTINEAEVIERNNHNPAEFIKGNNSSQRVVSGTIDEADQDWYKVYLPKDSNTILSVNSKVYPIFEIYDEDLNTIMLKYLITL